MRLLLLSVVLASLSGCCVLDGTCEVDKGGDDNGGEAGNDDVVASFDTPGCAADGIRESANDEGATVCASCDFDSDSAAGLEICGLAESAPCETRENSSGDACQLCVTDGGELLYDDCFSGNADRDVAFCEDVAGANADEACQACFDADGDTVSTTCAPRSDECVTSDDDARSCTVCSRDGVVVSRTCDAVDIDPAACRVYGNDVGRCVDCVDANGALLAHSCTPANGPSVLVCEETVSAEGIGCTVCVDENGTPVDRSCDDDVGVDVSRCEQLAFVEQTCIVCLDAADDVVSIDCDRNDCLASGDAACRADSDCGAGQVCFDGSCVAVDNGSDGGEAPAEPAPPLCEPPPACTMSVNGAGEVCRTCPFVDDAGVQQSETLCISTPSLVCSVVADTAEGDSFVDPQGASCVACVDRVTNVEVYRDCTANGTVPPPYCVDEDRGDGATCAVCYDAVDASVVYTSCPDAEGGETCFGLTRSTLVDGDGAPLLVEPANGDGVSAEAVVACKQCGVEGVAVDSSGFNASCALENVCDDPYGSARCEATTTLLLAPGCENPWDAWVFADGDVGELQAILSYALADHAIALAGARVVVAGDGGACGADGARVEVAVKDADVDAAEAAFAAVVVAP